MKKWYVITGILALFLLISLSTCSSNSAHVDRLEHDLNELEAQLDTAEADLATSTQELTQLKATKEITFGNGLKVFELSLPKDVWSSVVSGKVQNTGNLPMKLVYVIVAAYDKDGTLKEMSSPRVFNLYPNEVAEWTAWPGFADSYAVYAFGNR
ncbi:MAG: FxLYD domain-containing protein [Chloroflexota bacterium]|jgi:hypothetical protein|nr:FxLYD domain-containing protein [Chloroflexota bacterium]